MARILHLIGLFLVGCIASSLISWLATLHPLAYKSATFVYVLAVLTWGICWILDDAVVKLLRTDLITYRAFLLGLAATILIGLGVTVCTQIW